MIAENKCGRELVQLGSIRVRRHGVGLSDFTFFRKDTFPLKNFPGGLGRCGVLGGKSLDRSQERFEIFLVHLPAPHIELS